MKDDIILYDDDDEDLDFYLDDCICTMIPFDPRNEEPETFDDEPSSIWKILEYISDSAVKKVLVCCYPISDSKYGISLFFLKSDEDQDEQ